ncbi:MAG TPA: MerR family transcriptional regulator [Pseudonocardiaceae bacterium]|jgi:DNA-binding transcriptional MerR regulator|nr:MerR family transcriptional regulator [Pseudonocardiaceae bacterium]
MIEANGGSRWSIGALARASGVTVRALHHYDRIGLLMPEQRTVSGHRRYSERDVRRLYRIRALRALGLSLQEIAGVLAGQGDNLAELRELLAAQLRGVDEQAARLEEMRDRIEGLLQQIDARRMPDPDQFMATLELISVYENYFTQNQRDQLAARRAELGPEVVEAAKREWAGLVEELLPQVAADMPVDDPRVADLLARWDALGARLHPSAEQGQQTAQAARRMWQENSAELCARLPWPPERMIALAAYVERARQAHRP